MFNVGLHNILNQFLQCSWSRDPRPHSWPFQGVTLHVLEIKKIYQRIVNKPNANKTNALLSILAFELIGVGEVAH